MFDKLTTTTASELLSSISCIISLSILLHLIRIYTSNKRICFPEIKVWLTKNFLFIDFAWPCSCQFTVPKNIFFEFGFFTVLSSSSRDLTIDMWLQIVRRQRKSFWWIFHPKFSFNLPNSLQLIDLSYSWKLMILDISFWICSVSLQFRGTRHEFKRYVREMGHYVIDDPIYIYIYI